MTKAVALTRDLVHLLGRGQLAIGHVYKVRLADQLRQQPRRRDLRLVVHDIAADGLKVNRDDYAKNERLLAVTNVERSCRTVSINFH